MGVLRVWNGTGWDEIKGERGDNGASAYQIAVADGFVGTEQEWIDSLAADPIDPVEIENAVAAAIDAEPRVAANTAAIARVDPGTTGTAAQQLRVTVNGPRWLAPDSVSPLLFDAAGDGVANDYAAIMQAYDALGTRGGTIHLGGKVWKSNSPLVFNNPVVVDGGSGTFDSSANPQGGALLFAAGVSGVSIGSTGNRPGMSTLRNLAIISQSTTAGSDIGLTVFAPRTVVDSVLVQGFGSHGTLVSGDVDDGTNANSSRFETLRNFNNRGDGLKIIGDNANKMTFIGCESAMNTGYGVNNESLGNTFIGYEAELNGPTIAPGVRADYREAKGLGSLWLNPYSEGSQAFVIDTTSYGGAQSAHGVFIANTRTVFGVPTIWSGTTGAMAQGETAAFNNGWRFQIGNEVVRGESYYDPESDVRYEWKVGNGYTARNNFQIIDQTGARVILQIGSRFLTRPRWTFHDGTDLSAGAANGLGLGIAGDKVGFMGATPTTRPTVTGAKGGNAALTSLITALANLGLITDSTT